MRGQEKQAGLRNCPLLSLPSTLTGTAPGSLAECCHFFRMCPWGLQAAKTPLPLGQGLRRGCQRLSPLRSSRSKKDLVKAKQRPSGRHWAAPTQPRSGKQKSLDEEPRQAERARCTGLLPKAKTHESRGLQVGETLPQKSSVK